MTLIHHGSGPQMAVCFLILDEHFEDGSIKIDTRQLEIFNHSTCLLFLGIGVGLGMGVGD